MKKLFTSLFCLVALLAQSATYYVDYDGGNNSNAGTSTGAPWKHSPFDANATGNAASTTPAAGDTIQFKAGVRYKGALIVNSSGTLGNSITYKGTGWGTGKAILDGSVLFTNTWTQCTADTQVYGNANYANIWYANALFTNQTGLTTLIQSNQILPFAQITVPERPVYFDVVTNWQTFVRVHNLTDGDTTAGSADLHASSGGIPVSPALDGGLLVVTGGANAGSYTIASSSANHIFITGTFPSTASSMVVAAHPVNEAFMPNTTTITDTNFFTQTTVDFWRGAHIAIHKSPNSVSIKLMAGLNTTTDTITNAAHSNTDFYNPTPFEILGHPSHITYAGEYAVITNRIWMWPTNNSNPNNLQIYVGNLDAAISIAGESYITIDGFEVTGYYGGLDVAYSGGAFGQTGSGQYRGISILNCDIANCRSMTQGPLLNFSGVSDMLVTGNTLSDCIRSRGTIFNGTNVVVATNSWVRLGGTGIYFAGVAEGLIKSNYVFGLRGTHGNGISVYQGSRDCRIERNYLAECGSPITYENGSNYVFFNNFIDCTYGGVDEWGGMTGYVYWVNNTAVNHGLNFSVNAGRSSNVRVFFHNNIFDGFSWQYDTNVARSHNIWLDYSRSYPVPTMGPNESIVLDWSTIFASTNSTEWLLSAASVARGAGTNALTFGVTNDLPGYIRSAWDMGSWEYQSGAVSGNAAAVISGGIPNSKADF